PVVTRTGNTTLAGGGVRRARCVRSGTLRRTAARWIDVQEARNIRVLGAAFRKRSSHILPSPRQMVRYIAGRRWATTRGRQRADGGGRRQRAIEVPWPHPSSNRIASFGFEALRPRVGRRVWPARRVWR